MKIKRMVNELSVGGVTLLRRSSHRLVKVKSLSLTKHHATKAYPLLN
jgi:hypothetical protein